LGGSKLILKNNTVKQETGNFVHLHENSLAVSGNRNCVSDNEFGKNTNGSSKYWKVDTGSIFNFPDITNRTWKREIQNPYESLTQFVVPGTIIWFSKPLVNVGEKIFWKDAAASTQIIKHSHIVKTTLTEGFNDLTNQTVKNLSALVMNHPLLSADYKNITFDKWHNNTIFMNVYSSLCNTQDLLDKLPKNLHGHDLVLVFSQDGGIGKNAAFKSPFTGNLEIKDFYNGRIFLYGSHTETLGTKLNHSMVSGTFTTTDIKPLITLENLQDVFINNLYFKAELSTNTPPSGDIINDNGERQHLTPLKIKNVKNCVITDCAFNGGNTPYKIWNWDGTANVETISNNYVSWCKNPLQFTTYSLIFNESSNVMLTTCRFELANIGIITYKNAQTTFVPHVNGSKENICPNTPFNFKYISTINGTWKYLTMSEWIPDTPETLLTYQKEIPDGYFVPQRFTKYYKLCCGEFYCYYAANKWDYIL
jgi:hypothetical protein